MSQFKFKLPEELIAQYPSPERDEARLMVVDRKTGGIEHKVFKEVLDYFDEGDLLVFNDTKVFPALLYGNKEKTGARIEVFLLRELNEENKLWDVLVEPARKIRIGNKLYFGEDESMVAEVIDNGDGTLSARWTVKDTDGNPVDSIVFRNEYSYHGTATVVLAANKTLNGRTLKAGEFIFLLKDSSGNVVSKAVNSDTGAIQFAELNFDKPGVYRYTISEEKGNAANVTYDSTIYSVTITVSDSGKGYLTAAIDNGGKAAAFTNVYKEPEKDTSGSGGSSSGSGGSSNPAPVQAVQSAQTGDSSPIAPLIVIIAVSVIIIAFVLVKYYGRRRGQ